MGYTHYWYRKGTEIDKEVFVKIVNDFKQLLPLFNILTIKLGNGIGEEEPIIDNEAVVFNGKTPCGHKHIDLGITWPADSIKNGVAVSPSKAVDGSWFAGAKLNQRTCGGDCSHETFDFPRIITPPEWRPQTDNIFSCCKTAFKPYDLAVVSFLIIAKHHLGDKLTVHSDGEIQHWQDGMDICQEVFGYGKDFSLDEEG